MNTDLELLGQELERWAAMDKARVGVGEEQVASKGALDTASPTSNEAVDAAETPQETPPQEQQKPKKKRVRRQREELLYLRKKAKQLEDELERVQLSEAATPDAQITSVGSAASLWEGIASRQRQVRCQAEDENRRLKQMLENQLTLARRFECFLSGSGEPGSSAGPSPSPMAGMHCPQDFKSHSSASGISDGGGACFDDLLSELKVLYTTVDQVLPLVGPRTINPTILNAQVLEYPGANGVIIQWTTNVGIPFDWGVATRGMWRFIAHGDVDTHFENVEHHFVGENLVVRSLTVTAEEDGGMQWRSRQVVQRFMEAERTIIVSRSVWVSLDTTPSRLHGARFEENLQLVVARADDGGGGNSACVKAFTQTLPTCSRDADTGALTELVLRSIESNMRAMWPAVQSALIQEDLIPLAST